MASESNERERRGDSAARAGEKEREEKEDERRLASEREVEIVRYVRDGKREGIEKEKR